MWLLDDLRRHGVVGEVERVNGTRCWYKKRWSKRGTSPKKRYVQTSNARLTTGDGVKVPELAWVPSSRRKVSITRTVKNSEDGDQKANQQHTTKNEKHQSLKD